MENLTLENFWNPLKVSCPRAMDVFCKWIDKYEEENNWKQLFGERTGYAREDWNHKAPKFHELPFEFQNGIIARFDIECLNGLLTGKGKTHYEHNRETYIQGMRNLFIDLEKQLLKQDN